MSVPKDKDNLVYILYLMHGIAVIMPWHTMKEAFAYFNESNSGYFANYFKPEAFLSRILLMVINLFLPKSCGKLSSRMLFAIAMDVLVLAFVVLLMFSDTEKLSDAVLSWMGLGSNVLMNMLGGIYLSSAFGAVAILPMKYTTALCIGLNIEFLFVVVCNTIFSVEESAPHDERRSAAKLVAVILFSTSIIIHILCITLEITSQSNRFRVYYQNLADNKRRAKTGTTTTSAEEMDIIGNRYLYVFTQIYEQLLDIFLSFFVTFTLFPNIIKSIGTSNQWIEDKHIFSGVSLFITEIFNLIGVITAQYIQYLSAESLIAFTSARLVLIPIALFFNYIPNGITRTLPVLFESDLLHWMYFAIIGLTGGHLWALSMMYATKQVRPQYAHITGMMSSLTFYFAMAMGFNFARLVLPNFI